MNDKRKKKKHKTKISLTLKTERDSKNVKKNCTNNF